MIAFVHQGRIHTAIHQGAVKTLPMIFLGEKLDAGDVLRFESLTGIPRHVLRPDLYANPDDAAGHLHYASPELAGASAPAFFA